MSKVHSTSTSFISSLWAAIFSWHIFAAVCSFALFCSTIFRSFSVAIRIMGFKGGIILSSSTMRLPMTTSPHSTPRAVSTMTCIPTSGAGLPGAK